MKTQTIINCVFAVAFVGYVVSQPFSTKRFPINPTFDTITCKEWKVVDADGKLRIAAATFANGEASVQWLDKDEKGRIKAGTFADGDANVKWRDKDEKVRIGASTDANRIVSLPTKDLNPPKP